METGRVWCLNLEAELELAARPSLVEAGEFEPPARVRQLVAVHRPRARGLLAPGDVELREGERLPPEQRGWPGRAWCPTPRARALLRRAGALPEPAPALAVLRRVNHRRFCGELGGSLPGARYASALEEVRQAIARPALEGTWLLKRPLAMAGRGTRRIEPGALRGADLDWVRASLRADGLWIEPRVRIEAEFALHGWIAPGGGARLGRPCVQLCDERGAWLWTRPCAPGELSDPERELLIRAGAELARALAAAGYFGPFGMDGYRWLDRRGEQAFQPRGDVNARYTMSWAVGMADP